MNERGRRKCERRRLVQGVDFADSFDLGDIC